MVAVKAGFTKATAASALAYMACDAAEPFCHIEPRRDDTPAEPVIESKERTEMDITVTKETTLTTSPQTNYEKSASEQVFHVSSRARW